ncbi:MAG: diadenylate cyclase CdaA [Chloroflexota bacterium]|nr:diadenylate cyclase CdaA [Chloroflexota bacterium]
MTDILWVLSQLDLLSVVDILLVGLIIYGILRLIHGTRAVQLLRGVIVLVVIALLIINLLHLRALSWLIRSSLYALLVVIPVIFQPELRRALERLGRAGFFVNKLAGEKEIEQLIDHICRASQKLSKLHHGALIVLERETGLQDYIDTGVDIDSLLSSDLLLTIFHPRTSLHDGAVIVRGDRIAAAACVLPLAETARLEPHLGTRHQAAVGITEQSDALVVAVSEETGIISIAHNARMVRRLDEKRLHRILRAFYRPMRGRVQPRFWRTDSGWKSA